MTRPEVLNMQALQDALTWHDEQCRDKALAYHMHPIEVERLGFDKGPGGLPIVGIPEMQTGRFRVWCERQQKNLDEVRDEIAGDVDAVAEERTVQV